jgi:hypothetical protein
VQPLLDADVLLHELGWSGEFTDKDTGEEMLLSFEHVASLLDDKIDLICYEVEATEPPILYVSDSEEITRRVNKMLRWQGEPERKFTPNFRYEVATTKPYKGTRKNPKPFHFYNILFYMMANYKVVLSEDGLEADDMMCIAQIENAKEYGVKVDTHAGPLLMDYEDWLVYGNTTFIKDDKGYFINDTGKGPTRSVWSFHRKVMGDPEGLVVDHINGDTHDCRKYNLRVCSVKENIRNSKPQGGTSNYKGVSYDKSRDKWSASIKVDRKSIHLGRFSGEEDAAKAYDSAAKEYFGEFARLNFEAPHFKPFKQTVICSRDKDLRMCPLLHYSWECGNQRALGPTYTDDIGHLEEIITKKTDEKTGKVKIDKKILGYGKSFFYYQMLVGDSADNIPGLPKWGHVKAYELLKDLKTERGLFKAVQKAYIETMKLDAKRHFREQASLLWMVQEKGKEYATPSR